jgi:hypothetical protein
VKVIQSSYPGPDGLGRAYQSPVRGPFMAQTIRNDYLEGSASGARRDAKTA